MSSGILYRRGWSSERNCGGGAACGRERVAPRDQGFVFALAGGTASERDGSRQRPFDRERMRPRADQHRERTTLRRRRVGVANGNGPRIGANRPSGRPATESEPIRARCDKLATCRILTSGTHRKPTDAQFRVPVSVPQPAQVHVPGKLIASWCPSPGSGTSAGFPEWMRFGAGTGKRLGTGIIGAVPRAPLLFRTLLSNER